jgi:hypothetical protein
MTIAQILAVMFSLAPRASLERLSPRAFAVYTVTRNREEQFTLIAIDFHETTLGRRGIPFGVTCCYHEGETLEHWAALSLRIWRTAQRECKEGVRRQFGYYNRGRCVNRYARRLHRTWLRLIRRR